MLKKFNYVFFILFLYCSFLFTLNDKINICFIKDINYSVSNDSILVIDYLVDIAENNVLNNYNEIVLKSINQEDFPKNNIKKVSGLVYSFGINSFYYIHADQTGDRIQINIKLSNSAGSIIYDNNLNLTLKEYRNKENFKEIEKQWLDLINNSIINLFEKKEIIFKRETDIKQSYVYKHDFPLLSLSITAISIKIYFDERMNDKIQKIFSPSPIDVRLCFFPLRYLELGLFIKFDFNNMVYNYYDYKRRENMYYDTNFNMYYGFFGGFSFFNKEIIHYSVGLQVYNLYYDISQKLYWAKTNDYRSYFLPQFAIYQKIDFRLYKFLYFSLFFIFKTSQKFELKDNYFYSRPLYYDIFVLEFSFVGVSIIF